MILLLPRKLLPWKRQLWGLLLLLRIGVEGSRLMMLLLEMLLLLLLLKMLLLEVLLLLPHFHSV